MAQNTFKTNTPKKKSKKSKSSSKAFWTDRRFQLALGFFLILASLFLFTAFVSYLFTGKADQSVVEAVGDSDLKASGLETENWLGLFGATIAHYFIFRWFGIAAFLVPPLLFVLGYRLVFRVVLIPFARVFVFSFFFVFWIGLLLGYFIIRADELTEWGFLSGGIGYELAVLIDSLMGTGTFLLLLFTLLVFVIYFFNITTMLGINSWFSFGGGKKSAEEAMAEEQAAPPPIVEEMPVIEEPPEEPEQPAVDPTETLELDPGTAKPTPPPVEDVKLDLVEESEPAPEEPPSPGFSVEETKEEKVSEELGNYDPTLDLGSYQYPTLELLKDYGGGKVQVTKDELEQNKDKILETLINFKIGISSIKATIGPTVTLYEIVPEAGIKISKIKNLENDIALNLAALGIRIIAPIPGKGTIGIEVPNKNREMVSMKSVLSTEKFTKSDKELPVIMGKTISNEVFLADLTKMPHLLIAGATGQGKSVCLNVIIASLLYKKLPSHLKFILVDPKKVELTLYNKLERHFLAKLPDAEEPIINDTKKVVYTLNSMCLEMEARYELLKNAGCRNLKEYNQKFVKRQLNPEKGHRYLPYIVLVIDELADLMMTAGKEVEAPIARLAQLARAIGLHLIVATQRPSVNVITGLIKANFPARLSFRVTQKVDSRTILDAGGADQLVGMGDMLLSMGSEMVRLQCPFIDTPEVDTVCEYIGSQRGYESAYLLPEFHGDESGEGSGEVDLGDRDALFDEAARLIVAHQQGSTSLIQRKMKLGYNRAGRLIDQLEAAGIVGPFEGSKAREVLISDEYSLEQLLNSLNDETN